MSDPYQNQPYQPGPPVPYGQPYPPVAIEHPRATTVLVLGIVGFFVPVVSFVAWFMGNSVVNEIRSSGVAYSNEQSAVVGRILGIVLSILQLVSLVLVVLMIVFWGVLFAGVVATSGR